jgi:hypothetical protein
VKSDSDRQWTKSGFLQLMHWVHGAVAQSKFIVVIAWMMTARAGGAHDNRTDLVAIQTSLGSAPSGNSGDWKSPQYTPVRPVRR